MSRWLCPEPQPTLPYSGRTQRFLEPWCCWPPAYILPFSQRKVAIFGKQGHLSHLHPSPQTVWGGEDGPMSPRCAGFLVKGTPERSPASAARSGSPGRIWGLKEPVSRSLVWQPGSSRPGHLENPERLHPGHPSRPPFSATGSAIFSGAGVQPAWPRGVPTLQKARGHSAKAGTPKGQERSFGGQSRG